MYANISPRLLWMKRQNGERAGCVPLICTLQRPNWHQITPKYLKPIPAEQTKFSLQLFHSSPSPVVLRQMSLPSSGFIEITSKNPPSAPDREHLRGAPRGYFSRVTEGASLLILQGSLQVSLPKALLEDRQ